MKDVIICLFLTVLFVFTLSYISDNYFCNPKGSIAAKINWAGHKICKDK